MPEVETDRNKELLEAEAEADEAEQEEPIAKQVQTAEQEEPKQVHSKEEVVVHGKSKKDKRKKEEKHKSKKRRVRKRATRRRRFGPDTCAVGHTPSALSEV